ncbi:MAG TPA: MotA/TolQ/ExbB proton channel family protein [Thermodesulfobacteriota bacterium]
MIGATIDLLVKGGLVMIPLGICSVLALAIVIERAWTWWRIGSLADADLLLARAAKGEWAEAIAAGEASRSPVARVLAEGVRHRNPAPALAMEAAAQDEAARLKRYLPILDTIITLSPLLGLLGTVTGMIGAFGIMASSGMNEPNAITGGVAEALVATATGLGVAILALVPYNLFNARVESLLETIDRYGSRLELLLAESPVPRAREAAPRGREVAA